jgi:hypothetical protein
VVPALGQHPPHMVRHGRSLVGPEGDPHDQRFARPRPAAMVAIGTSP